MKLSIIVPVYNEARTIQKVLDKIMSAPLPAHVTREIVVVDDFSTDGTRKFLQDLEGSPASPFRVFYHSVNKGKGAALKTGFTEATGEIVLIQDADMEYDPDEYLKLIEPILAGKADVVFGSRFAGGEPHRVLYFWHSLANRVLTSLSNMLSDLNLTDIETCYKVFRKEVIDRINIEERRFGIEPEVTAKVAALARREGLRIYEVGISYHGRTYAEGKKTGLKDALRAFWCILKYNDSRLANLVKYGMNGVLVAASQLLIMVLLVQGLGLRSIGWQNLAYALSIEVSIITGFFLHALVTWRVRFSGVKDFVSRFVMFHLITGISFVIRQGVFYALSVTGMSYLANTLIGIAIAIILNFFGYDRLVFRRGSGNL